MEHAVQTFKQNFKRLTEGTLEQRLSRLLFMYRLTPHSTMGNPWKTHNSICSSQTLCWQLNKNQFSQKLTHGKSSVTEEAKDASAFVSYPPENSAPHSDTDMGTTYASTESWPTNSDITTKTAEITASHPSTMPNWISVFVRRNLPRNCKPPDLEKLTY